MKKSIICVAAFIMMISFSSVSFAKELKIGYLNFLEVFNEYKKTKDYDESLNKKATEKEKVLKDKGAEIEKLQGKLNVLKDRERDKEKEKVEAAIKSFQQLREEFAVDLKKEKVEKMKEIFDDIDKAIKDYARKNKFDFIIHGSAVLYGDNALDITGDILKIINQSSKR